MRSVGNPLSGLRILKGEVLSASKSELVKVEEAPRAESQRQNSRSSCFISSVISEKLALGLLG